MCVCVCVCLCLCVYVYIRTLKIFSSEGIDGHRVTQLRFERKIFCYDTSPFKRRPRSCRPGFDILVLMKTTWTLNSRVTWSCDQQALEYELCVISQKWLVIISKYFPNQQNISFTFQWYWPASVHGAMNEHKTRPNYAISSFMVSQVNYMCYFMQIFPDLLGDFLKNVAT